MRPVEEILVDVRNAANIYPAGSGHFVYTSGMHGDGYVDYRPLGEHTEHHPLLREVCVALLQKTIKAARLDTRRKIVVIGPETMGATMIEMLEAADHLGMLPNLTIFTRQLLKDPEDKKKFLWSARPREVLHDAQTIVIDDLLNQSSTFKRIAPMIETFSGSIDALAVIGDRCNVKPGDIGVRAIVSLEEFPGFLVESPDDSTLCRSGVPIVRRPGHGWDFEEKHPDYPGGFIDAVETAA
tara:strand:+ start:1047 stop:1766 length:720 start_codon:yes stop_codon:yes gene_type:complete